MRDRTEQPSALPAEFAERVGDPISYEDRVAWNRARNRYQKLERPMPTVLHVILASHSHFLVVDGTRGPVAISIDEPAVHPAGYARFRSDCSPHIPAALRGRTLFHASYEATEVREPMNEVEMKGYHDYQNAIAAARAEALARYPEAT